MIIDRLQGTDGIRGPVRFAEDYSASNPISALLDEGFLTDEFFELYTYAYCRELLESGFAVEGDVAVIGWDPRDSSGIFNQAAVRGIRKAGLTAVVVDVLPTPAIALFQLKIGAACGFVLTASHNPADQNGIKIFLGHSNLKLFPEDDRRLTRRCLDLDYADIQSLPSIGELRNEHKKARKCFFDFMKKQENHWLGETAFFGLTVVVDTANGAYSPIIRKLMENYSGGNFIFTNCEPKNGINVCSGVADLEGVSSISADEIESGTFSEYETLLAVLKEGRTQKENTQNGYDLVLGFVFDGDGDRCFLLFYNPFQDQVLVLGGDAQAFLQARRIGEDFTTQPDKPLFINTVESDLESGRAAQQVGFETIQCAVGDKWLLWQACLQDWKVKIADYQMISREAPAFKKCLRQHQKKIWQMVKNSKFDALAATQSFMTVEKWIAEKKGKRLLKDAAESACYPGKNQFAVGSEESGHIITLGEMKNVNYHMPVFIGSGFKCALNSLAAIQLLRPDSTEKFYQWLKAPFSSGYQKSLPIYYVDKSLLNEGSEFREELEKILLSKLKWSGMETEVEKHPEEPEMLYLRVCEEGLSVASVFVRNSGTEDKLSLYLRGRMEDAGRLEKIADEIYRFLLVRVKNKNSAMVQAEQTVLFRLSNAPKPTVELSGTETENIPLERLLHEMHTRQKLIQKENDLWKITELGRVCLSFSERSE